MIRLYAIFLILMTLASCAHSTKPATPANAQEEGSSIADADILPKATEQALGEAIATEIYKTYKPLEISAEFQDYSNEIAKNVGLHSHRHWLTYQVTILDTKDVFALGMPGGRVLISKGLLNVVRTETEFANLIGSQIAHIAKQHLIQNLFENVDHHNLLLKNEITPRAVQQSTYELLGLGFEIAYINEADLLGPTYAMHVGYDTRGLQTLLQNFSQQVDKKRGLGKAEYTYDWIVHRTSMSSVVVRKLQAVDKSKFPKVEDRFQTMIKKIKPVKTNAAGQKR